MSTALRLRGRDDFALLAQQYDEHHAPDGQQCVSDRVSDGVTQAGNLTIGTVIDHAEGGGCCARARATPEHDGIVKPEQILADVHRQYQGHGRDHDVRRRRGVAGSTLPGL